MHSYQSFNPKKKKKKKKKKTCWVKYIKELH